jgi:hypothetical protein
MHTQAWLELGVVDEVQRGIPALAVQWSEEDPSVGAWRHCLVVSHDPVTQLWGVQWDGQESDVPLTLSHRMHICFSAEDPVNVANRVAHALESRQRAEAFLRWVHNPVNQYVGENACPVPPSVPLSPLRPAPPSSLPT